MTHYAPNAITILTQNVYIRDGGGTLNRKSIAERLIKLRGEKSQDEVANAVNISKAALSMYENGERMPRDEVKIRLAKFYGKTVQCVFFSKDNTQHKQNSSS